MQCRSLIDERARVGRRSSEENQENWQKVVLVSNISSTVSLICIVQTNTFVIIGKGKRELDYSFFLWNIS